MKALVMALNVALGLIVLAPNVIAGDKWQVDPLHSSVVFKVKHAGISNFYGRFNKIAGVFEIDEKAPGKSSVNLEVWTGSVDTNDAKRDKHLTGPDFFNVIQFPKMTFKSKTVKKKSAGVYSITGTLLLHGVSKEITVTAKYIGTATKRGTTKCGYDIHFSIKRSDFGMKYGIPLIGDKVDVIVAIEAKKL